MVRFEGPGKGGRQAVAVCPTIVADPAHHVTFVNFAGARPAPYVNFENFAALA